MDRKLGRVAAAAVFALFSASAAANGPFCLVNNSGQASCFYYSLDACRQAQATMGGMCSANVQQQPAQVQYQAPQPMVQQQYPDIAGSFQRGQAHGAAMRQAREQSQYNQLQMQALQQQIEADQAKSAAPIIWYDCRAVQGEGFTEVPAVGCSVISIQ